MIKSRAKKKIRTKDLRYKYRLSLDLIDHIPDVVYVKDRKGRFVLVNQAHAKGLGLTPEQVVGKTDFDIFSKERAKLMARDDNYVMRTGKSIIDKIERATRPDGVDNYVSTTKVPRYDDKGKIIGLMGITRDITRRMQLERTEKEKVNIEKKIESLQEINKMKSEFVSIVSHELRTPLAIIKEGVRLILDNLAGPINEKQKDLLVKTEDNVERLKKIIEDLLDISRLESERFALRYSLVNLNSVISDTADFFIKLASQKGINIIYKIPKEQINVFIDVERIRQVVVNLINNAIKFTEQDGKITVDVRVLDTMVKVGVSDTGIGISQEDLPKLFNKFVQVSNKAGAEKKGVGLGLSICRELIKRHGGQIWVESHLGVGSEFYFTLPLLYTKQIIPEELRMDLNGLLRKNIPFYLINLLMVNYQGLKDKVKIQPKQLIADLQTIVKSACDEFSQQDKLKPRLFLHQTQNGEFSIVIPETEEKQAAQLCILLSSRIRDYFKEKEKENIFANVGILSSLHKEKIHPSNNFYPNFNIKRMYIGLESRRFERFAQKLKVKINLSKEKAESAHTTDISQGGICLVSRSLFKENSRLDIGLDIPSRKSPLLAKARVAWVMNMERPSEEPTQYKLGLEFLSLNDREKDIISRFLQSLPRNNNNSNTAKACK
ncbi:MAG: ATP-binding protein [Candidatus Omnitrophica bacterium]|nr:ATP-binding protein [Candidatus Omnitrophota bacterium]MDD5352884.1 ATP-binding protein [Candidatus Omnitrophota bacterium]MDD5550483.1 ATP-binding protein [Candidatus Omnitrophota bacterium]